MREQSERGVEIPADVAKELKAIYRRRAVFLLLKFPSDSSNEKLQIYTLKYSLCILYKCDSQFPLR